MKRLNSKINIVPIIAKADTLTPAEMSLLKKKVNQFSIVDLSTFIVMLYLLMLGFT